MGPMSRCVSLNHAFAKASANPADSGESAARSSRRLDQPVARVRRQHAGSDFLRPVVGVRDRAFTDAVLRLPLLRASRTRGQFPLVLEEVLEIVVAPPGRRRSPGDLDTARNGVGSGAGFVAALPAETLLLEVAALRFGADVSRRTRAVGLAECPPAMSATVSSSFIAMRRNVSRMSRAAAFGSGLPFGPSGSRR